ncbi:MAG: [FeFe] hydrogenase H-cluster maturation GTPase HydF [Treponemataceae bacterium]|nr:[FeFe] hydrogenase H-cluster maturation GTPase HydF [Spirochaetales bacterium]MDY6030837.1 [FeFe] hydrogenase H-cluster maturation GTPase HydF [Treponemataceae bacterium]
MSLQDTPQSQRLTIGIFGSTNSGKSTLLNALTGQNFALVSEIAGTTTDPVYKTMEINGIGPVLFIDTAGFSDNTELGQKRLEKTMDALKKSDVVLLVYGKYEKNDVQTADYDSFITQLKSENKPFLKVKNSDVSSPADNEPEQIVTINAKDKIGIDKLIEKIKTIIPEDFSSRHFTAGLCSEGDTVVLVMPQDIQAPKGRLILPQVQILRELLDKKCIPVCCTTDKFKQTIDKLKEKPNLIITDSQVFKFVYENKDENVPLTSFSVLMASNKGDINKFVDDAKKISQLTGKSKVLIAEACTHAPLEEDIGRIKIPAMLRKLVESKHTGDGEKLTIDFVRGADFPENLSDYDIIIQCGSCMFNRSYVLSRQKNAEKQNVAMTNYGIAIATISGIIDKIVLPKT